VNHEHFCDVYSIRVRLRHQFVLLLSAVKKKTSAPFHIAIAHKHIHVALMLAAIRSGMLNDYTDMLSFLLLDSDTEGTGVDVGTGFAGLAVDDALFPVSIWNCSVFL
jgi:hypothetical protein